jgi:nucleoside-diphosphate-sugar epimerase
MLKNKKILITGATGFIGANLTRYFLKNGSSIFIFMRRTSDKWRIHDISKDISEYLVDLTDAAKLGRLIKKIKPDIIIHTASHGGYPFQRDRERIIKNNFNGTVNLINACSYIDFELFINTGSSSEYGIKSKPTKETDILEPVSDYGISKAAATLYCHTVSKKENRPVVTFRLFSPYGYYEAETRLIPSLILSCLKSQNPKLSSLDSVRDFIFIEDILDAYKKAIECKDDIRGEIFNIGFGEQHTVGEVAQDIIKLIDNRVRPEWGKVKNPRQEPKYWQADISRAKRLLKWKPKYNLRDGLEKNIKWFRKNITLYKSS